MALKAQQSTIEIGSGTSPETFSEVEEVVSISGPDGQANLIDTTHLKSTGKEYLPGLGDFGQVTLECNFTGGTNQMALRTMFATQADPRNFRISVPEDGDAHEFDFAAIVTAWSLNVATDDKVTLNVTLQISGSVAYTPPA